jgi:uroporphyrinogen-III synthase
LRERGHEPLVDPVLSIGAVVAPPIDLTDIAALVVTSANAVPALTPAMLEKPLFCVGSATAAAARSAGFTPAGVGDDDGLALVGLLASRLTPAAGQVLHLCGEQTAASTRAALEGLGFRWRSVVVYRATAVPGLPDLTRRALEAGTLDAVLFFSPRTAAIWCRLVRKAGLDGATGRLVAACLSRAVAGSASDLAWREVRVAEGRDQTALLDCLDAPWGR